MSLRKEDLQNVEEVDALLRSLQKAAAYCTGPQSRTAHAARIREVEGWKCEFEKQENDDEQRYA